MISVNINNIDDIFYSKKLLETELRKRKELKEEDTFTLIDFISYLKMDKHIYITRNNVKVIPFTILNIGTDMYVFSTEENPIEMLEKLKSINYNFSNLKHKTDFEILNDGIANEPHFLIDNEFYI